MGIYDYSKLRGLIKEKSKTQEDVASAISLNPSTFSQRVSGKSEFKLSEVRAICFYLNIPPEEIPQKISTTLDKTKAASGGGR